MARATKGTRLAQQVLRKDLKDGQVATRSRIVAGVGTGALWKLTKNALIQFQLVYFKDNL